MKKKVTQESDLKSEIGIEPVRPVGFMQWIGFLFAIGAGIFIAVPVIYWGLWLVLKAWNDIFNYFIHLW